MTSDKTTEQIIAEALEILESKSKTAKDMRRLIQLAHELEERLRKGD